MAYIYQITNLLNGKQYIGKTEHENPIKRFKEHFNESKKDTSNLRPLYRAMQKYGQENFNFEVLEEVETKKASEREIYWIQEKGTYGSKGYNATLGGDGASYFQYSDEEVVEIYLQKKQIKATAKQLGCCEETISKILKRNNVPTQDYRTGQFKKQEIVAPFKGKEYIFNSISEASCWVVKEGLSSANQESIRRSISRVVNGKRKSYLTIEWRKA